jgi:hypothetical protein
LRLRDLSDGPVRELSVQVGQALVDNPGLNGIRALQLEGVWFEEGVLSRLAESASWSGLRVLEAVEWNATREGELASLLERWTLLTHLAVVGPVFSGEQMLQAMARSAACQNLRRLSLSATFLCDDFWEGLAASPNLKSLRSLRASTNQMTDRGAVALMESPHLTNLRYIDFSENALSAAVMERLRQRFDMCMLPDRPGEPVWKSAVIEADAFGNG